MSAVAIAQFAGNDAGPQGSNLVQTPFQWATQQINVTPDTAIEYDQFGIENRCYSGNGQGEVLSLALDHGQRQLIAGTGSIKNLPGGEMRG